MENEKEGRFVVYDFGDFDGEGYPRKVYDGNSERKALASVTPTCRAYRRHHGKHYHEEPLTPLPEEEDDDYSPQL